MKRYQCPCCDYYSLSMGGEYEICNVCFWEDGGLDIDCPDVHSGPNHMTLREGRRNFQELGACDARSLAHVMHVDERLWLRYRARQIKA